MQLTLDQAREAGEEGMTRAARAAGDDWLDDAYRWMVDYLRSHPRYTPDCAFANGCPLPPSGEKRSFGAVVQRALRNRLMVPDGAERRTSGHASFGPAYRSCIYEGRQG